MAAYHPVVSRMKLLRPLLLFVLLLAVLGCHTGKHHRKTLETPAQAGINGNNLVDLRAQTENDELLESKRLYEDALRVKRQATPEQLARRRSILCLSGGGSYGAYPAGVLCGWTETGDRPGCNSRPNFAVVTGISTGALIAPFAFLGPQYDKEIREFYTTVTQRDIYKLRPVRGLFSIALADNTPLANKLDEIITPQLMADVAAEHAKGRRLYVATTDLESKRSVIWDIGEIASRGRECDRQLIQQVLLGSSAIPGFFPPAEIKVNVDGREFVEKHGDGGTAVSIFFRPPFVPLNDRNPQTEDLAGVDLYMIVAGKLYADAVPLKPRSLSIASSSVSAVIYAQSRGDLQRLFLISILTGMNYHLAAIAPEFPAPTSSTDFEPEPMTAMFNEGFREAVEGRVWRSTPPGVGPGESALQRFGTDLTFMNRGPSMVFIDGKPVDQPGILAPGNYPVPSVPGSLRK